MKNLFFLIGVLMLLSIQGFSQSTEKDNGQSQSQMNDLPKKKFDWEKTLNAIIRPSPGEYKFYRLALHGGGSFLGVDSKESWSDEYLQHKNKLRWGTSLGADFCFYAIPRLGYGVKYQYFKSTTTTQDLFYNPYVTDLDIKESVQIHFIGPYLMLRLPNDNQTNAWIIGVSIGHMAYQNIQETSFKKKYQGSTLGALAELAYEFKISDKLSLGLNLTYSYGKVKGLSKAEGEHIELLEQDHRVHQNLNRLDLSLGISLQK